MVRNRRTSRTAPEGATVEIAGLEVLEKIGAGGFSVVYRARQRSMNREVAVKVLSTGFSTDAERRTFERECHALGRLSHHPNIVTVFNDAMTTDGRPCIVMELYHSTYRQRVEREGPLPIADVLAVGIRMCGALQTAHDGGVLHRDVKPHNIFESAYGEPALGDFGISTIDDERSQSGTSGLSVAYAAPEVLEDGRASVAADVYSLAASLFQLASGASPFASSDMKTTVRRILTETPPSVGRTDAPPGLDRTLRHALAKDPGDRPATALAFAEMLREVQARAGHDRTPVPRLAPPGTVDPTAGPGHDAAPAPPPPPTTPHSVEVALPPAEPPSPVPGSHGDPPDGAGDDDASGVTIARPRPPRVDRVDDTDGEPDQRRRWLAAGGAAVAIAVLALGIVVFGGGGDGDDAPSTTLATQPPDTFFEFLAPPAGVSVVALGDGRFEVTFEVDDAVPQVEVEVVGAGVRARPVRTETSPVVVTSVSGSVCVVLRSLGERGRVSADAGPFCSS